MQSIGGNLMATNVMTDPDTDDQKGGNFFNILPILMAGADRKSRRQKGQSELSTFLPSSSLVQPVLDDILRDIQVNELLTQGGHDMVALISASEESAEVAVLESASFEDALALAGSEIICAEFGEFRVMFLYEDQSGEVHSFAAKVDVEGQIVSMRSETGIAEQNLLGLVTGESMMDATRLGGFSEIQRDMFSLDS